MSAETAGASRARRTDRRDPRLPLSDMSTPLSHRLWEPTRIAESITSTRRTSRMYRALYTQERRCWTTCYINFRDLEPMMEIAWLIHREIQLGRFIVRTFNCATRLCESHQHGTNVDERTSLLQHPEEWVREVQAPDARYRRGPSLTHALHRPPDAGRPHLPLPPRPVVGTQCLEPSTRFTHSAENMNRRP
jgi:hypothetical protein